jgi:hypothetical protein
MARATSLAGRLGVILHKLTKYSTTCRNSGTISSWTFSTRFVPSCLHSIGRCSRCFPALSRAWAQAKSPGFLKVPILDRLVRHGLVIAEPANQGFLYRLNRDHLLAPSILQAAGGGFGGRRPPPAAVTTYLGHLPLPEAAPTHLDTLPSR